MHWSLQLFLPMYFACLVCLKSLPFSQSIVISLICRFIDSYKIILNIKTLRGPEDANLRQCVIRNIRNVLVITTRIAWGGTGGKVASEPRYSPFMQSVISCARAECNCVWARRRG